ncbi:unnamed protein product (macronuclear) [Paramecium tetraurelia]|uniref:Uncharacterized protein n=1 Tax=Paramecium tetraurelia TaxID=5888 RepID=A0CDA8_PARTE|nr:uncharacterized protein GSPATT00006986001 [Paramecium tetraurelia]CAK68775.1 unnamed protein product [Paramecium tetraurelia]|eukprot:XP_001436172.1 hypothetical protein (macronuclear) [Paramecium tetraurelia strain d4-2]
MIRRQNSLPEILSILQEKKKAQIEQQQPAQVPEQEPQPVFKYVLHEHQERIQLAKMFYQNLKKRSIARNVNEIKSMATLNGFQLKQGQVLRQKLYVEQNQRQENPQIYLCPTQKILPQRTSPIKTNQRTSPQQRSRAITTKSSFHLKSTDLTKNESMISLKKCQEEKPKVKTRQVDEVKGQTKLFTIVYKSLKQQS